jgi:hypothetical protein
MVKLRLENFKDAPVEADIPIEELDKGMIYQLVLAGNAEAIAYVTAQAKAAKND